MFERMLAVANHLGLFAEQTSMSGEALGNFPEPFTDLALISRRSTSIADSTCNTDRRAPTPIGVDRGVIRVR